MIALCFSQLFIQCSNDDRMEDKKMVTEQETTEISELKNFLSTSLRMDLNKIIYDSKMNSFIIDGDMLISFEDAKDRLNHARLKTTNKTNQMFSGFQVSYEYSTTVKVYIDSSVPPIWIGPINQAIDEWNKINSSIKITVVDISSYPCIKVNARNFDSGSSVAANASLPNRAGVPGLSITINANYNFLPEGPKRSIIMHELGHCFGFEHTNMTEGSLVSCTPVSDPSSIMFSSGSIPQFTYYDNVAISTLYPVVPGTKKMYRFRKDQYYFYTTNPCEITPSKNGYVFDGDAGYLYSTQVAGTVPLYRMLNGPNIKDHRLSTVKTSTSDIILGYLYPTDQPGSTPLFNYVSSYEYFPSNKHYLCTTIPDNEMPFSPTLGYVFNMKIYKVPENNIYSKTK